MKTYVITKKPRELDWSRIPKLDIDTLLWDAAAPVSAQAQLCYDEEALYVRLSAQEAEIRAQETGRIGRPCEDSCMEFFFSPDPNRLTYINIEMNLNCCTYLGIGNDRYDLLRLLPRSENFLQAQAERTEDGWFVTYRVEAAFIRRFFPEFRLESGGMFRGNFYKCGDLTPQPHYYSWNPVYTETPEFHSPQYFGKLYLE